MGFIQVKPKPGAIKTRKLTNEIIYTVSEAEFYSKKPKDWVKVGDGEYVTKEYLVPVDAVEIKFDECAW